MFNDFEVLTEIKKNLQGKYDALDEAPIKLTVSIGALFIHVIFLFLFFFLEIKALFYFNFLSIALWCWAITESVSNNYFKATIIGTLEIIIHAVFATLLLGVDSGFQLYLFCLLAWLTYSFSDNSLHGVFISILSTVILLTLYIIDKNNLFTSWYTLSDSTTVSLFISNLLLACSLMVFTTFFVRKSVDSQKYQLHKLATHDQLTNLYNRHYFTEFIQKYRQKSIRDKEPFCLVMADVDYFKNINDNYGHITGDNVLKLVADFLQKSLRSHDVIARWGGEEFLFVLVGCEKEEAAKRIEQLRVDFSKQILFDENNNQIEKITMSFGIVESDNTSKIDELISKADELLFAAKRSGRNKVITETHITIAERTELLANSE